MSYNSNFNLNWRISYLESIIASIVPFLPINLANTLLGGNTANNSIVLSDGVNSTTTSPTAITQGGTTSNTLGTCNVAGNVNLTGGARRITGDFSNGAISQRLMFQNSNTNLQSTVGVVPNGTATTASWIAYNTNSGNNSCFVQTSVTSTATNLTTNTVGTGTLLPFNLVMGSTTAMSVSTASVANFTNVPTCSTSATTTNQLVNWNNFTQTSFTPTLISTGGGAPTYTTQSGRFIRIGNWCCFDAEINLSGAGTLAAGSLSVALPIANDSSSRAAITIGLINNLAASYINVLAFAALNATEASLVIRSAAANLVFADLTVANINTASFRIIYSGSYTCA